MSEVYKFAAKNALRFPSHRGDLTVEQLFQLPLKCSTGFDLDTIARAINAQLKSVSEESFVVDVMEDPRKLILTASLDIVKDVIADKRLLVSQSEARVKRAAERKKILDAMAAKSDEKLSQATQEELEKLLTALDL